MVIIGITLGLVSLNAIPSPRQNLQNEAQRIALLLQLARDEAIVRNRLVAFEADSERYRFLVRNETGLGPGHQGRPAARARRSRARPVTLLLDPPARRRRQRQLRITFGREPVDKPFVLTLASGDDRVAIRADGVGHFVVE